MASDAEEGEPEGKAVDQREESLDGDDGVDESGEEFTRGDCVFLD